MPSQKGISYEGENQMIVKKRYLTILIVLIPALFFSCAKKQTGENDDGVDLVVVFTSGAYEVGTANVPLLYYDIIQNYILPALN
jgi:hypothetical protein